MPVFANGQEEKASSAAPVDLASVTPEDFFKGKKIRVVIGSTSVTGDTYLNTDAVCRMISQKYDCNLKVDPIGAGRALQEVVSAKSEGSTIMGFHDMAYLSVLYGAFDAEEYGLENMVVGGSYAYNPGDCFAASASAPYTTIREMADWMAANPDEIVKLAVEAGGVSQLGFNGIYEWIDAEYGASVSSRLRAFITGSTQEKLQALWDGNCQGIYAAASTVSEYTLDGVDPQMKVNVIGLMSPVRLAGHDWPTFAEQGIEIEGEPFSFAKEYFFFYPKNIDPAFVVAMDKALDAVCNSEEYKTAIHKLGYEPQFMDSEAATDHIYAKRTKFTKIVADGPSFDDIVD